MSWLLVVLAIVVIGVVGLVLAGRIDPHQAFLPEAEPDLRPEGQFDVVVRGYRMDEVDQRIADLEAEIAGLSAEAPIEGSK